MSKMLFFVVVCCLPLFVHAMTPEPISPVLYTPILFKKDAIASIQKTEGFFADVSAKTPEEIQNYINLIAEKITPEQKDAFLQFAHLIFDTIQQEIALRKFVNQHIDQLLVPTGISRADISFDYMKKTSRSNTLYIEKIFSAYVKIIRTLDRKFSSLFTQFSSLQTYYYAFKTLTPLTETEIAALEKSLPEHIAHASTVLKEIQAIPLQPPPALPQFIPETKNNAEQKALKKLQNYIGDLNTYFQVLSSFSFLKAVQDRMQLVSTLPDGSQKDLITIATTFDQLKEYILGCSTLRDEWLQQTVAPLGVTLQTIEAIPFNKVPPPQQQEILSILKRYFKEKRSFYRTIFYDTNVRYTLHTLSENNAPALASSLISALSPATMENLFNLRWAFPCPAWPKTVLTPLPQQQPTARPLPGAARVQKTPAERQRTAQSKLPPIPAKNAPQPIKQVLTDLFSLMQRIMTSLDALDKLQQNIETLSTSLTAHTPVNEYQTVFNSLLEKLHNNITTTRTSISDKIIYSTPSGQSLSVKELSPDIFSSLPAQEQAVVQQNLINLAQETERALHNAQTSFEDIAEKIEIFEGIMNIQNEAEKTHELTLFGPIIAQKIQLTDLSTGKPLGYIPEQQQLVKQMRTAAIPPAPVAVPRTPAEQQYSAEKLQQRAPVSARKAVQQVIPPIEQPAAPVTQIPPEPTDSDLRQSLGQLQQLLNQLQQTFR